MWNKITPLSFYPMYTHKPGTVCKNKMIGHKGSEALPLGRALKCQKIITVCAYIRSWKHCPALWIMSLHFTHQWTTPKYVTKLVSHWFSIVATIMCTIWCLLLCRINQNVDICETSASQVVWYRFLSFRRCVVIAKFHYTGPTGPARTQRSFAAKKVRAGPCGSGRVRVGSV